ncbi:VWA domain-containing protein [Streptomyces sp. NPDC008092]|uniref:VWA domain-containing protein n=1 Tax=Streptomyces sp. NPDC008092 TaxID=3364808 RepID=UPI0036E42199
MVFAFPGGARYPLENGKVADMARRAAVLGAIVADTSEVDAWVYNSQAHRLPPLRPAEASGWIEDWALLPKEPLFTQDAAPGNLLAQQADTYGLDQDGEDVAAAVRDIARSVPRGGVPTLVLFYLWAARSDGPTSGDRLHEAADDNVFWQFLGEDSPGNTVQTLLERLPGEAPHIRNVHVCTGWEQLRDTPDHFFFRGVLKPFARRCRSRRAEVE